MTLEQLEAFDDEWELCQEDGTADSYGGHEYRRILCDWTIAGCPEDVRNWLAAALRLSANPEPDPRCR
jgi:hypothetical protein